MATLRFRGSSLPSKRLVLSYVLDWVVIIILAAAGYGFHQVSPYHRPFSPVDLSIAFPHKDPETVPTWLLAVLALIAPGIIIFLVCILFVPGRAAWKSTTREVLWRRKLWEWNVGWMGLGLALATVFLITEGMKNLFGRPRPDLLHRCDPDLPNIDQFIIGNYAQTLSERWVLVTSGICRSGDKSQLDDGFRSFPSGHASFSWAGLLYLTFFLTSKFSIAIPYLAPRQYSQNPMYTATEPEQRSRLPFYGASSTNSPDTSNHAINKSHLSAAAYGENIVPIRNQAAAPPTFLLILPLIPIGLAIWITSSRFADFRHHGTDLVAGALLGSACAWFGFRWYHLPARRGAGWAWGARTYNRAFGVGVGGDGFVGPEGWGKDDEIGTDRERRTRDVEDVVVASRSGSAEASEV